MNGYRGMTRAFAVLMIGLGLAMVAATLAQGADEGVGILLGLLFVAVGVGRLYLLRRRR